MKRFKKPAILWALAGVVLSLLTLAVTVIGINSSPVVLVKSAVVTEAAGQTLDCVRSGDYDALGQMLHGAPNLGDAPEKNNNAESMLYYAFLDSLRYQVSQEFIATDSGISVDVRIQCMDISAVSESLQAIVPDLMNQIANEKGDEKLVYDEQNNYRDDFIAEVLRTATTQVLNESVPTMERDLTLEPIQSKNGWQVVPTESFLQLLSGYVSQ